MESWLYNPELEMMRWRLQVLAMGLQHQPQFVHEVPGRLGPWRELHIAHHLTSVPGPKLNVQSVAEEITATVRIIELRHKLLEI